VAHDSQDRQYAASTGSAQQSGGSTLPKPLLLLMLPDSLQLLFKLMLHKITLEALKDSLRALSKNRFPDPRSVSGDVLYENHDSTTDNGPATDRN
jgi:hypothetical protein